MNYELRPKYQNQHFQQVMIKCNSCASCRIKNTKFLFNNFKDCDFLFSSSLLRMEKSCNKVRIKTLYFFFEFKT